MNLDEIRFVESAGRGETLVLSLMSVAAGAGFDIDYDDLCAALGLSCTAASVATESALDSWMTYGRDAFVEPAARLFGIEVRDLQPPDVAVEMAEAEEFGQHWEYSYKPLIRRALEHDQPVLAWRGWAEAPWPAWGVITAAHGEDFSGWTTGSQDRPQILNQPALQCYVVERIEEPAALPRRDRLLAMALEHLDAYMNALPLASPTNTSEQPNLVTGPAAFEAWAAWINFVSIESEPWIQHQRHANRIATGHESAARFLRRMEDVAAGEMVAEIKRAQVRCDRISSLLNLSHDAGRGGVLFQTAHGRNELTVAVQEASSENLLLADDIHLLARVRKR